MNSITIAQFSDCHLFSTKGGMHYGHNVFTNLTSVLSELASMKDLDAAVFTGDLTQDHSDESYQLFNQVIIDSNLSCPIYWLAGNHDDTLLLSKHLTAMNIQADKDITMNDWRLLLIDSKSDTPAGLVNEKQQGRIRSKTKDIENTLIFMHHHAIDVGYFIDKHGLKNQQEFWMAVDHNKTIKAICCGHIHQGLNIVANEQYSVPLYTCPATSIQFDPQADTVSALNSGPGYRLLELFSDGTIKTSINHLPQ
ncbi:metallophosphoesterase [Thalassotalea nanhaiensis]|uniref:Metallophosphoesterase n=1 Tax=Thalassotalea nanhaiensis TaxID=3065648 RepID=A0ABY9TM06_9GAMM|nr:metallophosphoesterase [Colwelliaceae bacterium SQ345]